MKKVIRNSFLYLFVLFNIIYLIINSFNVLNFKDRNINIKHYNQILKFPLGSTFKDIKEKIYINNNNIDDDYIVSNNEIFDSSTNKSNKISINSADINELIKLPGIGEKTALKIIEYRNKYGKYLKIEDIKNVSGIGDKKYERIKELISI